MVSPDSIVPDPTSPQSFNRYSYTKNNPVNRIDPSGHVDCSLLGDSSDVQGCNSKSVQQMPLVFYLNGLGGQSIQADINADREYNTSLAILERELGSENVVHVPLYTENYRKWPQRFDMLGESLGINTNQTQSAANQIIQHLSENPLQSGQRLVLVGSSAGGTVAIEVLDLLEEEGIYVDQVILRGSLVNELWIDNVGQVDYLAADPPYLDLYFSLDINPFDSVSVNVHIVPGLKQHTPNSREEQLQIGEMIVNLILEGSPGYE